MVRNLLVAFWPEHPQCYVLTDGISQASADVWSFPAASWVELLQAGLARIGQERPQARYVLHMLEDHCPLRRCDAERLARIFAIAAREDFAAISFPTYAWPWHETDPTEHPDGLIRTWRRKETRELEGELFAAVPRKFFRYFQVQPTLWRLDYLQAACAHAQAEGIGDVWAFEAMRWRKAEPHFVSRYDWPTVHHGFLAQGRLNPAAIAYLDRKQAPEPHRTLVREAIGIESPLLFDFIQALSRTKGLIRSGLAGVRRRVTAKAQ
ncbi:MAG: hypothetical protein WAL80_26360 [Xanthobacteraceae bacterium]